MPAFASRRRASAVIHFPVFVFHSLVLLCLAASAAQAQRAARVRPAFEPKLVRRQTVSGIVRFRIVARRDGLPHEFAPIGSGGWAVVVRIDGHLLAARTKLPAIVEWDTRKAGDGIHEVHVAVRNPRGDQEVGVEGAPLIVDNASADTAAEAAQLSQTSLTQQTDVRDVPSDQEALILSPPSAAKVQLLKPRLSRSVKPLATRATALLRSGSRLYIGLPDGGLVFCTPDIGANRGGSVVRLPIPESPVLSLAAGGGRVWWSTEGGRAVYAYTDATHVVTRYDVTATLTTPPPPPLMPDSATDTAPAATAATADADPGQQTAGDAVPVDPPAFVPPSIPVAPAAPPKLTGWVREVVLLRGRVLLIGDSATLRVLDPRTGALTDGTSDRNLLPEGAIPGEGGTARLYAAAGSDSRASALVVSVVPAPLPEATPAPPNESGVETIPVAYSKVPGNSPRWRRYVLRAWRCQGEGDWKLVGTFATDATPERTARLAVAPDALATAEREGLRLLTVRADSAHPLELPYALSPGMPSSTDRVVLGPSGLWWEQRGIVFRADTRTGARDAFLPWNVQGEMGAVLAIAADDKSVWVATTSAGIRRIRPGRPDVSDGYNGYVRARLGSGTLRPQTERGNRVAGAIEAWQGVPYVWGGQSRSGADCSGFVMRMHQVGGVSIPRTSAGMRHASQGKRVRDELRWGDTLVYPGHCAIYIGDGRTAETVGGSRGGSVSHSSIWIRSSVVVRRFLR
ncbi:MAG: C40 family peptidase [Armatimonadota bacterium]